MNTTSIALAGVLAVAVFAVFMRSRAAQASTTGSKPPFGVVGPLSLKTLKLTSSEKVNHDVKRLRFELPGATTKSGLTLTSALLTISFPNGGWAPVLRPYTPVTDLDEPGHIDFLVKRYPGGKQSTHLHSMKPGDTLTFMRIPGYAWKTNEQAHIVLIAGGQGITPCYQLARGILQNIKEKTKVTLIWGVNTDDDIILAEEFGRMEREHPDRFKAVYTVLQPKPGSRHIHGMITKEVLRGLGIYPGGENQPGKIFVCGPPPMEKALTAPSQKQGAIAGGDLIVMGFKAHQIHCF